MLGDTEITNFSINEPDSSDLAEKFISYFSGRFVALLALNGWQRMYLDPAGQLSAVFRSDTMEIGSSLFLISEFHHPNDEISKLLDFPASDRFFPFGLTIDSAVNRLLPNHYLDLDTFLTHRHWPKSPFSDLKMDVVPTEIPQLISGKLRSNISALAHNYPISMALTAGKDSRMLLAAAREHRSRLETFTTSIPDQQASLDCTVASTIATTHDISHRVLKWVEPNQKDLDAWQLRGGYSGSGRTWHSVTTLMELDPKPVYLTGLCGEVARAYYWKQADLAAGPLTALDILERLRLPDHPVLRSRAEGWLEGIDIEDRCETLDLLYIEQRLGCWGGPNYLGHVQGIRLAPLADRQIFEWMLCLDKDYRLNGRLPEDSIRLLWPELLQLPFNTPI